LTVASARGALWAYALFALTFAARFVVAYIAADAVLDDRRMFGNELIANIFLLMLRDLIAPVVWIASFMGNRIYWRGDVFDLKDGRLIVVK
jgi:ceramide glucosyltransferase